ncbi:hypothetical protein CW734_13440 [Planococcus sp. MB-3u-03]|nr:hypothetical protein CW734_13440 [Planococcus sp. MB-3u-03]
MLEYEELAVEGLDRYNGTITYWTVEDKFTDKDFFGIVIFQNGYDMRFHRDGEVMPGYVSTEDREFKLISIQKTAPSQKNHSHSKINPSYRRN